MSEKPSKADAVLITPSALEGFIVTHILGLL